MLKFSIKSLTFGNPVQSSDILFKVWIFAFLKVDFFAQEKQFWKNLIFKLFQLSNDESISFVACLQQLQTLCSVNDPIISNLGQDARTWGMLS